MKTSRILGTSIAVIAAVITLILTTNTKAVEFPELYNLVLGNYTSDTMANNSVASIYLNYRVFDTIFEALMLLVSVMGVIHFSRHDNIIPYTSENSQKKHSPINSISLVIPLIFMFGFYLIINGHNTPGGGFQGGAALTSAFICVYLVRSEKSINFYRYEKLEKILFLFIALTAIFFGVSNLYFLYAEYNIAYLIIMNVFIGLKVFCGLTIVFYRFVHFEDT